MKATELIGDLTLLIEMYGDKEVVCLSSDNDIGVNVKFYPHNTHIYKDDKDVFALE